MKQKNSNAHDFSIWIPLVILLLVLLDQGSKIVASSILTTSCNKNIIFGFFSGGAFTVVVPVVVLLFLLYVLQQARNRVTAISLLLIIGGGISNILDRIFIGCVRDFISIGFWPRFNLADCAISLGMIMLLYKIIFKVDEKYKDNF